MISGQMEQTHDALSLRAEQAKWLGCLWTARVKPSQVNRKLHEWFAIQQVHNWSAFMSSADKTVQRPIDEKLAGNCVIKLTFKWDFVMKSKCWIDAWYKNTLNFTI